MFLRVFAFFLFVFSAFAAFASAQENKTETKPSKPGDKKEAVQLATAEQVAESAVFIYGGLLGRQNLEQIRKTTFERGKTTLVGTDGRRNTATYERFVLRGETMLKERIRVDQSFPDTKFSLIFNNSKIFAVYNETFFTPREDASRDFQNLIWHSIDSLLRYKENASTLELVTREKVMGVDFFIIDVTDKQERKTRFYVSVKSLRVMMLEYESEGVKYRRKFYDYNYAQGTLVPYRSVLWAGDREIEETEVGTVTFGQKIDDAIFQEG